MNIQFWKDLDPGEVFSLSLKAFGLGALIFVFSLWITHRLPSSYEIREDLRKEPEQELITRSSPFQRFINGHTYRIEPKAQYRIRGLVVEGQDSSSWKNITHLQAGDFLNTHDLCVVWGKNAISPYLNDWKFSHGDWTCYVETSSRVAWESFKMEQISNNHILPASSEVLDVIRSARIGDQIEMSGQLVNYTTDGGPSRNSSLVRTDTGNGACEILYVESAQILQRHKPFWYALKRFSQALMLGSLIFLFLGIFVIPFFRPRPE